MGAAASPSRSPRALLLALAALIGLLLFYVSIMVLIRTCCSAEAVFSSV